MSPPSRCAAVVVSYNSAAELPACLASLRAQRGVELVVHVVDNASRDGSAVLVRERFPEAHLTANPENVGFARANNQLLGAIDAEYMALVNPDTILPPEAIATCVAYLEEHGGAGVAATRLVNADGTLQPSCHTFLGLRNLLGETFGVHRAVPGMRPLSSFHMPWFAHDEAAEVDWIQGAFLVVRAAVVRAVGGFDPDFFMYGEEMDWCYRIRCAGWKVAFLPAPPVVHQGGASSQSVAGPMFVENLKGRVRFLRKHRGPLPALVARGLIGIAVLLRFTLREAQGAAARLRGREPAEPLRLRRRMFRAAMGWVLRGMPLRPLTPAAARPRGNA